MIVIWISIASFRTTIKVFKTYKIKLFFVVSDVFESLNFLIDWIAHSVMEAIACRSALVRCQSIEINIIAESSERKCGDWIEQRS